MVEVAEGSVPDVAVVAVRLLGGEDRIAAVVHGTENVLAAGEQPPWVDRVADGGHDEGRGLQRVRRDVGRVGQRVRDPVHVDLLLRIVADHELAALEGRERELRVGTGGVESVRAAVCDVDLQPVGGIAQSLPGAVVLRAGADAVHIVPVVIEGVGRQRAQAAIDGGQPLRDARKDHLAEGDPARHHEEVRRRRAIRRVIDEDAVRSVHPAVAQVEELAPVQRIHHQGVVVGMQRAGIDAAAVVLRHVGEDRPRVGREQYSPSVRAAGAGVVLVVLVRARQIHRVDGCAGLGRVARVRGGVDVVVVRALRLAVGEAVRLLVDPCRLGRGSRGVPDGVVHAQARRGRPGPGVVAAAGTHVHPRFAAGQRHDVELVALGGER